MAFSTGQGSALLAPGIRNVLFQAYNERSKEYADIFNVTTSERNYEEDLEFIGLGTMPTQPEGTGVIYADPTQGGVKRYTHVSFGKGFRITRQMMDDDLYGVTRQKCDIRTQTVEFGSSQFQHGLCQIETG